MCQSFHLSCRIQVSPPLWGLLYEVHVHRLCYLCANHLSKHWTAVVTPLLLLWTCGNPSRWRRGSVHGIFSHQHVFWEMLVDAAGTIPSIQPRSMAKTASDEVASLCFGLKVGEADCLSLCCSFHPMAPKMQEIWSWVPWCASSL